jgi:hypothetical protein
VTAIAIANKMSAKKPNAVPLLDKIRTFLIFLVIELTGQVGPNLIQQLK